MARNEGLRENPETVAMEAARALTMADGVTVAYRVHQANGARGVLVLLHGLASNHTRWSEFVSHTALKRSWDILRPDLRGHGESSTRTRIGMELWCADLEAILQAEGYRRAVLVGHSLGANLAVHFGARHPDRVAALALIDPVLTDAVQGRARWLCRLRPALRFVIAVVRALNVLGLHRRGRFPTRDLASLDEEVRTQLLAAGKQAEFIRRYSSTVEDLRYFPTANYLQEVIELFSPLPPLASIRRSILALISKGVTFTNLETTKRILEQHSQAEVELIDAYHWPLTEKPVEVREAIERWCARVELDD